jgi:hypothetical protein
MPCCLHIFLRLVKHIPSFLATSLAGSCRGHRRARSCKSGLHPHCGTQPDARARGKAGRARSGGGNLPAADAWARQGARMVPPPRRGRVGAAGGAHAW